MNRLSNDAMLINDILKAVKCMTVSQVCTILPGKSENAYRYILSQLYRSNYISFIDHNYLVPYKHEEISRESVLCMWAMLDDSPESDTGIVIPKELQTICRSDFPAQFMYIHDNKLIDTVYIHKDNTSNLLFLQNSILNRIPEEALGDYCVLIVIEDESLIDQVAAVNLAVPNTIALAVQKGDLYERPEFVYYK